MEEKEFTTFGADILTGNAQPLNLSELIQTPDTERNIILPHNIPDVTKTVTIGDVNAGKIRVLTVPSDRTGVGKYRSIDPHRMLHKMYGDEFYVEINPAPDYKNLEYFKNFHIVHITKAPSNDHTNGAIIVNRIKDLGCKVVVDTDDYWRVDSFNPHYVGMKHYKIDEKLIGILKVADVVTTTTPILADEIRKYNKNVVVLENAIDPEEPQFQPKPWKSDRLRIGFLGGSSHLPDIELLGNLCNRLIPYQDQIQLVLVGYDLRGSKIENVDAQGNITRRQMKPEESVWYDYEQIFTSKWTLLQKYPKYVEYLKKYKEEPFDPENPDADKDMPYRRLWTRDIHNYAKNYNNLDISLAPLDDIKFNLHKSQLKAVEAGFFKKALVAQAYGPYLLDLQPIIVNGQVNPDGNAYLIETHKNHKDWFKAIKFLMENPDVRELMGENLYKLVNEKFHLRKITEKRAKFYRSLL